MRYRLRRNLETRAVKVLGTFAYRALHVVVPVVLIAIVIASVGAEDVVSRLRAADPAWILAAIAACSAQILLCALRWRLTADRLGTRMSAGAAISEYYLSSVINTTVPGGVVGDAVRAARAREAAGLERAAQAVVIERFAGQIALGTALLLGLGLSGRPELQWTAAVAAAAAAALGGLVWGLRRSLPLGRLPSVLQRFLAAIKTSWFERRTAIVQTVLSVLIVVANLAALAFAARATGASIGFPEVLFAAPIILAAMLVPFSVAGWGYREGAAAAVFPLIGATAAAGVSASVVFGAVLLVASLPGLAVFLLAPSASRPTAPDRLLARHESAE